MAIVLLLDEVPPICFFPLVMIQIRLSWTSLFQECVAAKDYSGGGSWTTTQQHLAMNYYWAGDVTIHGELSQWAVKVHNVAVVGAVVGAAAVAAVGVGKREWSLIEHYFHSF